MLFTTRPLLSRLNVAGALRVLSQNVVYHCQIVQPLLVVAAAVLHEGVEEVRVAAVRGRHGAAVLGHKVVLRQLGGGGAHPAEGVRRLARGRVAGRAQARGGSELVKTGHSLGHGFHNIHSWQWSSG